MISLSLCGIRGGVGTTSLLAAMGHALNRLNQRVLLVELCPENVLGLHFNLAARETEGWARAMLDGQDWYRQAWQLAPGLCLLPYGGLDEAEQLRVEQRLLANPWEWNKRQAQLAGQFDWVLFDLPQRLPGHVGSIRGDFSIRVLAPDMACHVLLQRQGREGFLLVNGYDSASRLQQDLLLVWRRHHGERVVPVVVHQDEAMGEALACKQSVIGYAPQSLVTEDAISLATWCLSRRREVAC